MLQPFKEWLGREEKTSGGRPIIICPTCCCDLVIFVWKPYFERSRREFGGWGGGGGAEKRGGKQGQKEKKELGKKKEKRWAGGWRVVSRTTVKWLRCYHSDSNEGSQDTLGGCRRRGLGRGGGGRRESDGKEERGGVRN